VRAADSSFPTDSRPDLGAEGPAKRPPVAKLADDHIIAFGKPSRIGNIEVTPTKLSLGPTRLQAKVPGGKGSRLDESENFLHLRLKLKNVAVSDEFAPFDPAFLREPDRGFPASFIETGTGDRISPYPLATESEWSIVGQSFEKLVPGETKETVLVSAKGARAWMTESMTWRFPIRTAPDRTEVVGVRFRASDVP
jgi:hypothetical protein